jgi:hypothetical protein
MNPLHVYNIQNCWKTQRSASLANTQVVIPARDTIHRGIFFGLILCVLGYRISLRVPAILTEIMQDKQKHLLDVHHSK